MSKARNFWLTLTGRPLPVDEAMVELSTELKTTVARLTTSDQRKVLIRRFPEAELEAAFADVPARKEGVYDIRPLHHQANGAG